MVDALEALTRLQEGNRRHVASDHAHQVRCDPSRRAASAAYQEPFAVVLGCSDSRVPVETIFDQGLGDLFVIRVAGNIVASTQMASVEFAAAQFGTRLVVVLGHSRCGAVTAVLEELAPHDGPGPSPDLKAIVDRVRPGVEKLATGDDRPGSEEFLERAVRANIRAAADRLRTGSSYLKELAASDGLLVVGAEYDLESGAVQFFDGLPDTA